ncbi:hypothetical protein U1Q18_005830 [Sarracenia purpurea var. burkii]
MAEERQGSRLWLPWLQATPAPAEARAKVPSTESQSPTMPATTTTPAQKPPFRPPGSSTTQVAAPPQAQAPPRNEPQPSPTSRTTTRTVSPSHVATQSRAASKRRPPSRTSTQSQGATQPPSLSLATTQHQASSQPSSKTRTASETQPASQADPQPQSPLKWASQPAAQTSSTPSSSLSSSLTAIPAQSAGAVDQLPLPLEKLKPITQEVFEHPPLGSTEPPSSVSQEEPKAARSQSESQELLPESHPKAERTSENVLNAHPNEQPAPNSEATVPVTAPVPTSRAAMETLVAIRKSDSSFVNADRQKSDGNPQETIEGKEIVQEYRNKQKINGATEEPNQKTVTELLTAAPDSEKPTKMHPIVRFDKEQKQLEKEEVVSGEETIAATSSTTEKQTKTVISNVRDKNPVSESHRNPIISNMERAPLHKEIKEDISKFIRDISTQQPKHPLDDIPGSVITLSGENIGASMRLGAESSKREKAVHIFRGYKINPDETIESSSSGGEGSSKRRLEDPKTEDDHESKAYINSNVQGINNSIMFNSSVTERNPGVQLALSQREHVEPNKEIESLETTHKAEFNVTPAQKLTYEPSVRRRCLRGLFLEPNDSAPDNPDKPRHHGCRYVCKTCKDNKTDIL